MSCVVGPLVAGNSRLRLPRSSRHLCEFFLQPFKLRCFVASCVSSLVVQVALIPAFHRRPFSLRRPFKLRCFVASCASSSAVFTSAAESWQSGLLLRLCSPLGDQHSNFLLILISLSSCCCSSRHFASSGGVSFHLQNRCQRVLMSSVIPQLSVLLL